MKKKIVAMAMILCMALMLIPQQAFAYETYNVSITFTEPYVGEKPAFSADSIMTDWSYYDAVVVDTSYNSDSFIGGVRWETNGTYLSSNDVFEEGNEYTLSVRLISAEEHELSEETSFSINNATSSTVQIVNSHTAVVKMSFLPKEVTAPTIVTQPNNRYVTEGNTAWFEVKATGGGLTYQWQVSKDNGSAWTDVNATKYPSAKTARLEFTASTATNGYQYRCVVSNSKGEVISSEGKLTVYKRIDSVPVTITQPRPGASPDYAAVFPSDAHYYCHAYNTGNSRNGVEWYDVTEEAYLDPETATFVNGHTYKFTIYLDAESGYEFPQDVVVTVNGKAPSYYGAVGPTFVVEQTFVCSEAAKPTITTQPKNATVELGKSATFKVAASDAVSYQWYYKKSGESSWTKWSGKTSASLKVTGSTTNNGCQYRCKVTNAAGYVYSKAATLTVTSGTTKPTITTQPSNKTTTLGTSVTFKVVASGATSYQWEYSKNNGATWTKWSGKTSASVSVKASTTNNGCLYRCKVTNSAGTVTSSKAKLTVSDMKPTVTGKPSAVTVSAGGTAKFTVVAAGSGLKYKWQVSKDGGKTWTNINQTKYPSAATATLSFKATAATNGYMYRCVVSNSYGSVKTTGVKLTVN